MIKKFIILAIATVLALMSFTSALGSVYKAKLPMLAMSAWPTNGFAFANQANIDVKSAAEKDGKTLPQKFEKSTLSRAITAFEHEPLAYRAVTILALSKSGDGKIDDARSLMRLNSQIVKRDQVTNMWLAQDYGKSGNIPQLLNFYDRTLRSSAPAAEILLPLMAAGLSEREMIDPLFSLLSTNPPWATDFWSETLLHPDSLAFAAELRTKLNAAGVGNPEYIDAALLQRTVDSGHYDPAWRLYLNLSGRSANKNRQLVTNSNFSREPVLPPMDWQLFSTGTISAAITPRNKMLQISEFGGGGGVVARQFIKLLPGKYRLDVNAQAEGQAKEISYLRVILTCAAGQSCGKMNIAAQIDSQRYSKPLEVNIDKESYFWLNLSILANDVEDGFDLDVRKVALTKLD